MYRNGAGLAIAVILLFAVAPAPAAAAEDAALRRIVQGVMDTGLVPGMAIAVVQDGRTVMEDGFGYADIEAKREVTRATRFYTASTSKAVTALAVVRMAARGVIDLDEPLATALPGATWHPQLRPAEIRVRDLVTLTHGIDTGPIDYRIAFAGQTDEQELLAALAEHAPAKGGRVFHYDNLGYDLLGLLIREKTGATWREALDAEVLRPLGMRAATSRPSKLDESEIAVAYELGPDGFDRCLGTKTDANMGPANGLYCTAGDLARLVLFELGRGRLDGRQIAETTLVDDTQAVHATHEPTGDPFVKSGWGLGWDIGEYAGTKLLARDGTFAGWYSHVSLLPERGVGIVILVNGGNAAAMAANSLAAMLYDHLLQRVTERPFLDELTETKAAAMQALAAERDRRAARPQVMPLPFAAYVGTYANPTWGTVELAMAGDRLEAKLGVLRCAVEVYDGTKGLLRVDMAGQGKVMGTVVPTGEQVPAELKFLGQSFRRR